MQDNTKRSAESGRSEQYGDSTHTKNTDISGFAGSEADPGGGGKSASEAGETSSGSGGSTGRADSNEKMQFVENMALFMEQVGLTRMAGRIYAYLMVADEQEVSFDGLAEALQASKGSISSNVKVLERLSLIESVSLPGDRRTYYRFKATYDMIEDRLRLSNEFVKYIDEAARLRAENDELARKLDEFSEFYRWLAGEFEKLLEKAKERGYK